MKLTIDGCKQLIANKWLHWYRLLIIKRKKTPCSSLVYSECHHILPRSMGGTNDPDNLIQLTAKEHFIAHLLLTKFVTGNAKYSVITALYAMTNMKTKFTKQRYKPSSRIYEISKLKYIEELRERMKLYSPFKNPHIHKKCMDTRTRNKSNVFITNNPMLNEEYKKKKIEKTRGANNYLTKKFKYRFSNDGGKTWVEIPHGTTVKQICDLYGWSISTFNNLLLYNKIPSSGPLLGVIIERYENKNNNLQKT